MNRRKRSWCALEQAGGYGLDALWNDDFHHSAMVALTGRNEAYYTDYRGQSTGIYLGGEVRLSVPGAMVQMAEAAPGHAEPRTQSACNSSTYIQNHDQIANSARGNRRPHADQPRPIPRDDCAAAAGPGTPMLFQGQEFASSTPFLLFRRSQAGTGKAGPRRPREVPGAIPQSVACRSAREVCSIREIPRRFRNANWILPSGSSTRDTTHCIKI